MKALLRRSPRPEKVSKAKAPKTPKAPRVVDVRPSRRELRAEKRAAALQDFVLPQYRRESTLRTRLLLLALSVLTFFVYGYLFGMFAPQRLVQLGLPLLVLVALNVWALPELGAPPTSAISRLFFIYFLAIPLWPNYLAIALPGLPWITVMRLTGFPLVFLFLYAISTSVAFRAELMRYLRAIPVLWKFVAAFAVIQLLSVALSNQPQTSTDKLLVTQVTWTSIFFISAFLFIKPGRVERWAALLIVAGVILSLIAVQEFRIQHVLWLNSIPSFLKVNDPNVQNLLAVHMRAGTDRYRTIATYATSLGLSEFLALVTPFALHFVFGASYKIMVRALAAVSIPLILYGILLTDSRLGFVGFLISIVMYGFFRGALEWRQHRTSLWGPALVLSYPAAFSLFVVAIFTVQRLRVMTLGGGKTEASTQARADQVHKGIPLVLKHPFGFGIGRGADALNYRNAGGGMTIDTYWLLVALDYGIIGFIVFYGMILTAATYGFFGIVKGTKEREQTILIPLTIALVSYFIIKSIYAGVENQSIVFMMLGATAALVYRQRRDSGTLPVTRKTAS
jgi:hypothetical protein